jgi:hypothetical protein
MHCFVFVEPEKITQDRSKNLKEMNFYFGDTKCKMGENDTFDLALETKRVPGEGI